MNKKLILASGSPRRAQLLEQMGVSFESISVDIDETPYLNEVPIEYVKRLATQKAQAVSLEERKKKVLILGSDTAVVINGNILGKPVDKQHALEMLTMLSGKTHQVLTSVALLGLNENCLVSESKVTFKNLSDQEKEWYWMTGEPLGKAGGYAIQGKAAMFIEYLEGSFSAVMGLPLYETANLLKQEGYQLMVGLQNER